MRIEKILKQVFVLAFLLMTAGTQVRAQFDGNVGSGQGYIQTSYPVRIGTTATNIASLNNTVSKEMEMIVKGVSVFTKNNGSSVFNGSPSASQVQGKTVWVDGKILVNALHVPTDAFADYVFDKDYKLMSLSNLRKYINTYRHLPGIPSQADVLKEGEFEMKALTLKLLEKVEELTLYTIEQDKQITEAEKLLKSLKEN